MSIIFNGAVYNLTGYLNGSILMALIACGLWIIVNGIIYGVHTDNEFTKDNGAIKNKATRDRSSTYITKYWYVYAIVTALQYLTFN